MNPSLVFGNPYNATNQITNYMGVGAGEQQRVGGCYISPPFPPISYFLLQFWPNAKYSMKTINVLSAKSTLDSFECKRNSFYFRFLCIQSDPHPLSVPFPKISPNLLYGPLLHIWNSINYRIYMHLLLSILLRVINLHCSYW